MMKDNIWLAGAGVSALGVAGIICAVIINDAWAVLLVLVSLFMLFAGGYLAMLLSAIKGRKQGKHVVRFIAATGIAQLLISAIPEFLVLYSAIAFLIGAVVLWHKKGKQKGEIGVMISSVAFASAAAAWSYFIFGGLLI